MSSVAVRQESEEVLAYRDKQEVLLGVYESAQVPAENLIMLAQVRGGKNPEIDRLKDSIDANGMINPIDVARMTRDDLAIYISFVNRVWKSEISIEQFDAQQIDGAYYLVVAGHSRTTAVNSLAEEHPDRSYVVNTKVHPISTPEDIINLQLEENIHSKPPVERQAMAIIEAYQWGLEIGRWTSQQEFIRQQRGAINKKQLQDAIGFAQLPDEIRKFVFGRHIPYTAALELGRDVDTLIEYEKQRLGYDALSETDEVEGKSRDELLNEALWHRIVEIVMHISKSSLNSTASRKYIQGQVGKWRHELGAEGESDAPQLLELTWVSPTEEANDYINGRRQDFDAAMRALSGLPVMQAQELLRLSGALVGVDTAKAERMLEETAEQARRMFGGGTLSVAMSEPLPA